jgi:tRNA-splicing ligase RtcB (3'-phosphate/5'-hydroxy nucleic acid ligase)
MTAKDALREIRPYLWEIPTSFRSDMRVPARVFATEEMIRTSFGDRTLEQLVNVATLPGIVGAALAMPDAHEGYGFPIGGVAGIEYPNGVISPGGIGYDINCGVRLLKSEKSYSEVRPHLDRLAKALYHFIPSGVGRGGKLKFTGRELDHVLQEGARWIVKEGYGEDADLTNCESGGCIDDADPDMVSDHAKARGSEQIGTMGAGNHFVEVDVVDEIFDEEMAREYGLFKGQMCVLIHTGSRGLGHQVATDYIKLMGQVMSRYGIELPDRELACVPFSSKEGQKYFKAMNAAANFAWANRQMITFEVREAWRQEFGKNFGGLSVLYDVAHNIAKIEEYEIEGQRKKLLVHRKGATRAFVDQPVLIPGSMGTASYVLAGAKESLTTSFGSTCHGAGRAMSRHAAKKQVNGSELLQKMKKDGISVEAGSLSGLAEEAPIAYKDVDLVVEVVHQAGIAKKVARLKPCAVIKG